MHLCMHKYCRRKCFYIFYSFVYWCSCIEQTCLSKLLGWYSVHSQDDLSSATYLRISVPTVVKRIQKVPYRLIDRIVLHMWKSIGNQAGSTWTILQLWQRRRICRAFRLESLWAKCPANPPFFIAAVLLILLPAWCMWNVTSLTVIHTWHLVVRQTPHL